MPEPCMCVAPPDPRTRPGWELVRWAASQLPAQFTAEDLAVACWQRWPALFGILGFEHYPDNNRVLSYVWGRRGLVACGWLERVGPGRYRYKG